jgi:hypothetical protein
MRGDVDVWLFCWQRSNRTMSWGDPMASSGHQTRYHGYHRFAAKW